MAAADIVVKRTEPGEVIEHETVFYENPCLYPDLDLLMEGYPECFSPLAKEIYCKYKKSMRFPGRFRRRSVASSVWTMRPRFTKTG